MASGRADAGHGNGSLKFASWFIEERLLLLWTIQLSELYFFRYTDPYSFTFLRVLDKICKAKEEGVRITGV